MRLTNFQALLKKNFEKYFFEKNFFPIILVSEVQRWSAFGAPPTQPKEEKW